MSNLTDDARDLLKDHIKLEADKENAYGAYKTTLAVCGLVSVLTLEVGNKCLELSDMVEKSENRLIELISLGLEKENNE